MSEAIIFPPDDHEHQPGIYPVDAEQNPPVVETLYDSLKHHCQTSGLDPTIVNDDTRQDFTHVVHDWTTAQTRPLRGATPIPQSFLDGAFKEYSLWLKTFSGRSNDSILKERFTKEQNRDISYAMGFRKAFPQISLAIGAYQELHARNLTGAATATRDLLAVYGRVGKKIYDIRRNNSR